MQERGGGAVGPEKLEIQVYTFGSKNEVLYIDCLQCSKISKIKVYNVQWYK